jgi:hypothetical protein
MLFSLAATKCCLETLLAIQICKESVIFNMVSIFSGRSVVNDLYYSKLESLQSQ